jgi:hypothetical protein
MELAFYLDKGESVHCIIICGTAKTLWDALGIRIRRIRMFSGLQDPDPFIRGADPDPDPSPDPDPDPSPDPAPNPFLF